MIEKTISTLAIIFLAIVFVPSTFGLILLGLLFILVLRLVRAA